MFEYHAPALRWSGASLCAAAGTSNCPILPLSGTRASRYAERRSGEGREEPGFMAFVYPHTFQTKARLSQFMTNSGQQIYTTRVMLQCWLNEKSVHFQAVFDKHLSQMYTIALILLLSCQSVSVNFSLLCHPIRIPNGHTDKDREV